MEDKLRPVNPVFFMCSDLKEFYSGCRQIRPIKDTEFVKIPLKMTV